jgi:cell division protein FtsB
MEPIKDKIKQIGRRKKDTVKDDIIEFEIVEKRQATLTQLKDTRDELKDEIEQLQEQLQQIKDVIAKFK